MLRQPELPADVRILGGGYATGTRAIRNTGCAVVAARTETTIRRRHGRGHTGAARTPKRALPGLPGHGAGAPRPRRSRCRPRTALSGLPGGRLPDAGAGIDTGSRASRAVSTVVIGGGVSPSPNYMASPAR